MSEYQVAFQKLKLIAENTYELQLKRPADFSFKAGQYISVTLPQLTNLKMNEQFHDFSISSSPTNKLNLTISFRDSMSSFKQQLHKLQPGNIIIIESAAGNFILPKGKVVMIAGGIGVTPFMSIIRSDIHLKQITLLCFNSSEKRTPYKKEIREHAQLESYFFTEQLNGNLLKQHVNSNITYMTAGSSNFVRGVKEILNIYGVDNSKIISEDFPGYDKI